MKLRSDSFDNGARLDPRFAFGAPGGGEGGNRNPHLAWGDAPAGTRSYALLCLDPDAPTDMSLAGRDDVQIPVEHPRREFVHWAMADIPAAVTGIAEGAASDGTAAKGRTSVPGPEGARQGLNGYTASPGGQGDQDGDRWGYDGPQPPPNDLRPHRYFFRVFALDVERLDLPERFSAAEVLRMVQGHVLAETAIYGTYALNPDVRA
ncbi:YbhB/YbcL family Raf kinase inhibitor-like protein [Coralloluteibacterium stylophorae]|uniref:YbhB/YbcL family Raf kinase inhibitor-like protein n=1 Tax=Coralloluteibacterium stylophorae TaxID=1776034 RepID=A0A8J7VSM9_9GAMM|nr:YbhB/YbcL family Raf kinase inhibitor-like protein [Coralloluteibacterium stylophorae]MBS7457385.1 YbhB/YbcL family Raf kinase inhibitor-like protein [Coralloluteibacterium stylophorae]